MSAFEVGQIVTIFDHSRNGQTITATVESIREGIIRHRYEGGSHVDLYEHELVELIEMVSED